MKRFDTPVLFIIFNRPSTTKLVFEKISTMKPSKLYIVADGPRESNKDDNLKCKQAREIVKQINWDCEVHTKFHEKNLGCGLNVSSAISWVFEHEDRVIILEDDTLPSLPFFHFCDELLKKYEHDTRIMHISGSNFNDDFRWGNDSYYFSMYTPIWGWATWKRAWRHFDYYMKDLKFFIESEAYKNIIFNKREQKWFVNRWLSFYKSNYITGVATNWDYQWEYAVFKNNGLSIIPNVNLISNIGIDGTHNSNNKNSLLNRKVTKEFFITKHPDFSIRNLFYDKLNSKRFNREKSLFLRIISKVKKVVSSYHRFSCT